MLFRSPPLLVAWTLLFRTDLPPRGRVMEAAWVGVPGLVVLPGYLLMRHHVLGGLGGYHTGDDPLRAEWVAAAFARPSSRSRRGSWRSSTGARRWSGTRTGA